MLRKLWIMKISITQWKYYNTTFNAKELIVPNVISLGTKQRGTTGWIDILVLVKQILGRSQLHVCLSTRNNSSIDEHMGSFTNIRRLISLSLTIQHNIGGVGLKILIRVGPHLERESPIFIGVKYVFHEVAEKQRMSSLCPVHFSVSLTVFKEINATVSLRQASIFQTVVSLYIHNRMRII